MRDDQPVRWIAWTLALVVAAGCGGAEERGPGAVAGEWVRAINDRDWPRACELSAGPEHFPCDELLASAFDGFEGDIALEGAYFAAGDDQMSFSLDRAPDGFSAGRVQRQDGELRVHWEAQLIR